MLSEINRIQVRFSEVDSLRIVWHGHYLKYFEDGREAFGRKYGLAYMDVFNAGLLTSLVKINCEYKMPVKYEDPLMIETTYIRNEAAKIMFTYKLFHETSGDIYANGDSMQVFLNFQNELLLNIPDFYLEWKRKWNLI